MKITFLGTGAGEGYPGLWCQCVHCSYARKHGGRNVRTNSSALVDDGMMLDISHACFDVAAIHGIDLSQVTTLLVTHPHEDHVYAKHLLWRRANDEYTHYPYADQLRCGGPRFTAVPKLNIYGNQYTRELLESYFDENYELRQAQLGDLNVELHDIHEGVTFEADGYAITPVRGNHVRPGFSHGYIIQKDGKTMLYALDSDLYDEDMMELMAHFHYDLVVMEGTSGLNRQQGGHMALEGNTFMLNYFREKGCYGPESRFVLTHLSPHWCPPHDFYEHIVMREGMILAYDGMSLVF